MTINTTTPLTQQREIFLKNHLSPETCRGSACIDDYVQVISRKDVYIDLFVLSIVHVPQSKSSTCDDIVSPPENYGLAYHVRCACNLLLAFGIVCLYLTRRL